MNESKPTNNDTDVSANTQELGNTKRPNKLRRNLAATALSLAALSASGGSIKNANPQEFPVLPEVTATTSTTMPLSEEVPVKIGTAVIQERGGEVVDRATESQLQTSTEFDAVIDNPISQNQGEAPFVVEGSSPDVPVGLIQSQTTIKNS